MNKVVYLEHISKSSFGRFFERKRLNVQLFVHYNQPISNQLSKLIFCTQLRSEWIVVFWITFVVYVVGTFFYCLMLSGESQHWAVDDEDEEARDTL